MGIFTGLLTAPLLGPLKGIVWVAEKVAEQADKELYNEPAVRGKLMELELAFDLGEITEAEYLAGEEILMERLRVIRERQAAEREE